LLWFVATDAGLWFFEKAGLRGYRLSQSAVESLGKGGHTESEPRPHASEFHAGERVRITDGTFEAYEAEFVGINPTTGGAMLSINIFGRETPVELPLSLLEPC
jgi:transcription antitermination factor NusG